MERKRKSRNVPSLIATLLFKRNMMKSQTQLGDPYVRGYPYWWIKKEEEHEIDFRVPGLSHAVVKEAEHLRVQELVKKIESHPHREALQADLQHNNVCNPFQQKFEGDDPRNGYCGVVRVVRN